MKDKTNPWPDSKEDLTREEAEYIRHLRVVVGCTWRSLSEHFCEKFYPEAATWPKCAGNQIHGMNLCEFAAELLGEDHNKDPWN